MNRCTPRIDLTSHTYLINRSRTDVVPGRGGEDAGSLPREPPDAGASGARVHRKVEHEREVVATALQTKQKCGRNVIVASFKL